MTTEELLKPRYKVVADFWRNPFKVGEILMPREQGKVWQPLLGISILEDDLWEALTENKYPHIFDKLGWWQERKPAQMPKYVKDEAGEVFEVVEQGETTPSDVKLQNIFTGAAAKRKTPSRYGWHTLYDLFPATEQEFSEQNKKQKA